MKYIGLMTLLVMISLQPIVAQEIGKKEIVLMNQIARNCLEFPFLKFPRPEIIVDRELQNYQDHKRWFMRDYGQLKAYNQDALNSQHIIRGKPFSEHVSNCTKLIKTTQSKLENDKSAKPSKKAQTKINDALWQCELASKWIDNPKKYNANYSSISTYYDYYINTLNEAQELDNRVVSWKKEEIEKCNQVFVPKYLALKEKKQKEDEAKRAVTEAKRLEHQQKIEAAYAAKRTKAESLGYKGVYEGITTLVEELNQGYSTIDDVKPYLVVQDYLDKFSVVNLVDNYAVYGYSRNTVEYIQVAVVKQPGQFYGDGAMLADGFYAIDGIAEFITVLGAKKQLIILRKVSE